MTADFTEHDVIAGPGTLHYQEWGKPGSPAIILLHGFGLSGHMFDEFAPKVATRYHLFALDQRGHGDSSWAADGDYSREAFVADVEAFRASLGVEEFILVGHSMGGLNAVTYTQAHPGRVKALVLVDVGPEAAKEGVENIARFTRGPDNLEFEEFVEIASRFNPRRDVEAIRARLRTRLKPTDDGKFTWKFDKRFREDPGHLKFGSNGSSDDTWQLFRSVAVPTLLIRGAESDVLLPETAERVVREMPRARLAIVPNAGHSVPGDNPEGFTTAVESFLADLESGVFAPAAAAEPPPLEVAVDRHRIGRKRGSLAGLVVLGVGAALVFVGVRYTVKRRRRSQGIAAAATAFKSDMTSAQRHALELATELSAASRTSLGHARSAISDIHLDRARAAAMAVVADLEDRARELPVAGASASAARRVKETASKRTMPDRPSLAQVLSAATVLVALANRASRLRPSR